MIEVSPNNGAYGKVEIGDIICSVNGVTVTDFETFKTEHSNLEPRFFPNTFLTWISFRSISKCQLNALLHLHLIPIYLVVYKGSYYMDISS